MTAPTPRLYRIVILQKGKRPQYAIEGGGITQWFTQANCAFSERKAAHDRAKAMRRIWKGSKVKVEPVPERTEVARNVTGEAA